MKFNKWTLGLAAVGAVSMTSAVRASEPLNTALSSTTISGYIDVGAQYNAGNVGNSGNEQVTDVPAGTSSDKVDSFSLNTFDIAIDKPQDDSPWAAGYHGELEFGQDLVDSGYGSGDFSTVRQAYVVVRTPVGNGIDWKFGVMDNIIGYESNTDGANPNYTRSIGYEYLPTTLVGMIGAYKVCEEITVQAGLAENWTGNSSNIGSDRAATSVSSKSFAGAIALTAPDSWGWAKGATLNLGALLNIYKGGVNNFNASLTIPTPVSALKVGAAFDVYSDADSNSFDNPHNNSGWIAGLYGTFQATDKLSLNLRGEYYDFSDGEGPYYNDEIHPDNGLGEEVTATLQYNLWANVISRVEFRWDHVDQGNAFGAGRLSSSEFSSGFTDPNSNSFLLAVNLIYSF